MYIIEQGISPLFIEFEVKYLYNFELKVAI